MSNGKIHKCAPTVILSEVEGSRGNTDGYAAGFLDSARNDVNGMIRHIYVHIPFCARICPYCAFYKDLLDRSQTSRFCEALLQELAGRERRARCLVPSTIYFGGGTPTALNMAQLDLLL